MLLLRPCYKGIHMVPFVSSAHLLRRHAGFRETSSSQQAMMR